MTHAEALTFFLRSRVVHLRLTKIDCRLSNSNTNLFCSPRIPEKNDTYFVECFLLLLLCLSLVHLLEYYHVQVRARLQILADLIHFEYDLTESDLSTWHYLLLYLSFCYNDIFPGLRKHWEWNLWNRANLEGTFFFLILHKKFQFFVMLFFFL